MTLLMSWYKIFYWVTIADSVKHFFDVFSDIFTTFAIISLIVYVIVFGMRVDAKKNYNTKEEDLASMNFWVRRVGTFFWMSMILCVITWFGYVVTPTKKDALVIIAGGAVGTFITSDSSAKQIPYEMTLLLREKLKSEIQELKAPSVNDIADTLKDKTKEELIELLKRK